MPSRQAGTIAATCGAVCCSVLFFVLGVPMIIAAAVLFSISNGAYDDLNSYEHCPWYENYDSFEAIDCENYRFNLWSLDDECRDCDILLEEYEDWEESKKNMRIAAIILVVLASLMLVAGVIMVVLMCTTLFQKGVVHSPASVGQTTVQVTQGFHHNPDQQYSPPSGFSAPYPTNLMATPPPYTEVNAGYPMNHQAYDTNKLGSIDNTYKPPPYNPDVPTSENKW